MLYKPSSTLMPFVQYCCDFVERIIFVVVRNKSIKI